MCMQHLALACLTNAEICRVKSESSNLVQSAASALASGAYADLARINIDL